MSEAATVSIQLAIISLSACLTTLLVEMKSELGSFSTSEKVYQELVLNVISRSKDLNSCVRFYSIVLKI